MERVRRHIGIVDRVFLRGINTDDNDLNAELIFLHFRKALEEVAFASLAANREKYSAVRAGFATEWNARRMLGFVEKVNPNFYPVPVKPPQEISPGHKFFDRVEDGFLTKEDFVTLYDGSAEVLHCLLWSGTGAVCLFHLQRVRLFREGVLNPSAHFHPVTLAKSEVEEAIRAIELLQFAKNKDDFAKKANDLLGKAAPTQQDLIDTSCYLRTAYETDLRGILLRHGGTIKFRDDWTKIEPAELWDSAKSTMTAVNNALAAPLIADIEAHPVLFLNDWKYSSVSALTKPYLDAAWAAIRVPVPAAPKTRLAAFA